MSVQPRPIAVGHAVCALVALLIGYYCAAHGKSALLLAQMPGAAKPDSNPPGASQNAANELRAWEQTATSDEPAYGLDSLQGHTSPISPYDSTSWMEQTVHRMLQDVIAPPGFLTAPDEDADDNSDKAPSEPDISTPGPDMGDFPNSAFTLPKGRAYMESGPFTLALADQDNPAGMTWPYMFRYGLTDDVELRITGSGVTSVFSPSNTTGFSPVLIDTKIHLWDAEVKKLLPAMSLEVYVQTNWGSQAFKGGVQPSINLNMDFPISKKTNIEVSIGYSGVQDALSFKTGGRFIPRHNHLVPGLHGEGLNVYQPSFQWALEQQVTEKFQVFLHGFYNGPIYLQSGPGKVIGVGYFYQFTKRTIMFNSYNAGLDSSSPDFLTQLGAAIAF